MTEKTSKYRQLMIKISHYLPESVRPLFLHPAGPTTVFFWAPTFKWGLVLANIADINRPVEKISMSQNLSLMLSSSVWCRYSLVIKPVNYNLFSVNAFVCGTSGYLLARKLIHEMKHSPK